jgi:signal transduction histidine kinase
MLLAVAPHLESLAALTAELPSFLQERLHDLSSEVRTRYRMLIVTTWTAASAAAVLLTAIAVLTYRWVFRPLRMLGHGSRRVAAGDFAFRITLDTRDEMAELADAFNDMTERFQEIRDDLDRQVQERTREVIRSEQLASVGFLAAGVAHEINNPLASIAMCAESLESRIDAAPLPEADAEVARRYLALIQSEAFRCKGITEKLLDFSRLGEVRRQATALAALVTDVADMLRHVGRFAGRSIVIDEGPDVLVMVNPQEIKQVVLNLLVNALDSIEETGSVRVTAKRSGGEAMLTFSDDGCGMTPEVLEHLFEPFFTRRKAGQGTGLGLSIVHRIVADHGGRIQATSDGPGKGSTFRVTLPLAQVGADGAQPRATAADAASGRAA